MEPAVAAAAPRLLSSSPSSVVEPSFPSKEIDVALGAGGDIPSASGGVAVSWSNDSIIGSNIGFASGSRLMNAPSGSSLPDPKVNERLLEEVED